MMSATQAGFGTQRGQQTPVHDPVAFQKAADSALKAYLENISDEALRRKHAKFFQALVKAQGAYVNFPAPTSDDYIDELNEWIKKSHVHRRLGFGSYFLESTNKLEIGPDYARLKKGTELTAEQARSLAMAIYLNPKAAKNGVTVTGTPQEQALLVSMLDEINALNPGAHQVKIHNRAAPAPAPNANPQTAEEKVDSADPSPRSARDEIMATLHNDPAVAEKIWDDLKTLMQQETRIGEPQPESYPEPEKYEQARQEYHDALKEFWGNNEHLHAEMIKNAGGAIPMPDESKGTAANDAPAAEVSDDELTELAGDLTAESVPTRESVAAQMHKDPEFAAATYDFVAKYLQEKLGDKITITPHNIEKAWKNINPEKHSAIFEIVKRQMETRATPEAKAEAQPAAPQSASQEPQVDRQEKPAAPMTEPAAQEAPTEAQPTPTAPDTAKPTHANGHNGHNGHANGHTDSAKKKHKVEISEALLQKAFEHVVSTRDATQDGLRHALNIGDTRARAILERLQENGVVSARPNEPFKPRRVLMRFKAAVDNVAETGTAPKAASGNTAPRRDYH